MIIVYKFENYILIFIFYCDIKLWLSLYDEVNILVICIKRLICFYIVIFGYMFCGSLCCYLLILGDWVEEFFFLLYLF